MDPPASGTATPDSPATHTVTTYPFDLTEAVQAREDRHLLERLLGATMAMQDLATIVRQAVEKALKEVNTDMDCPRVLEEIRLPAAGQYGVVVAEFFSVLGAFQHLKEMREASCDRAPFRLEPVRLEPVRNTGSKPPVHKIRSRRKRHA